MHLAHGLAVLLRPLNDRGALLREVPASIVLDLLESSHVRPAVGRLSGDLGGDDQDAQTNDQ